MKKKARPVSEPGKGKDLSTGKGEHLILDQVDKAKLWVKSPSQIEKPATKGDNIEC